MRQVSPELALERARYRRAIPAYLEAHPFCQITIALHGLDEQEVIARDGQIGLRRIPRANQIHHRLKRDGERLNRQEFWMSAAHGPHRWTEDNKKEARIVGILCPIEATPTGLLPAGRRCLTTPELMAARAAGQTDPTAPA
jgi:hypothetical protein